MHDLKDWQNKLNLCVHMQVMQDVSVSKRQVTKSCTLRLAVNPTARCELALTAALGRSAT